MQFTNPIWLWGLTGLFIPIGIHLLSRKESRIILMGSIRHIEASHTKQSVNLRLNELLLLAMRCLLITLLVLLLSGLQVSKISSESWLMIDRGMEKNMELTSLRDSLQSNGFKIKYLEEQFPEIDSDNKNTKVNYWGLLETLSTLPLDKIVVLSYSSVEQFKGKRITIPANITWISVAPAPIQFPAIAIRSSDDSISVREANSSVNETTFVTVNYKSTPAQRYFKLGNDSVLITHPDTLDITFVTDPEFAYDKQILQASLQAIEEVVPAVFNIKHTLPDQWSNDQQSDWLIWLSMNELPASSNTNSILFLKINSVNTDILEQKPISGKLRWLITKRLNEEIALQEKLPLRLAFVLFSKENNYPIVRANDRRSHPEKLLWSTAVSPADTHLPAMASGHSAQFLVMLIFISLLTERLIAYSRNQ